MRNNKNLIFGGVVVVVAVGFIVNGYFSYPAGDTEPTVSPDIVQDTTPTPMPTLAPIATEEPFLGLHGIKAPATCQVEGEVDFSDPNSFTSKDSKISWQNVDSQGRLINWRVNPQDGLAVGPNIFGNLTVPDGDYENITIRLPEKPVSKSYLLTASITYGQIVQDDVKIREATCLGEVRVNLNF